MSHSNILDKKVKAGALLSVIVISLVIFLLVGGLFLHVQLRQGLWGSDLRAQQVERNLASALRMLLAEEGPGDGLVRSLDLYGEGRDSIWTCDRSWGIYQAIAFGSHQRGDSLERQAILGHAYPQEKRYALYLADEERPLSVSGRSLIVGHAYLPPAGLRKAYIENQSFEGDQVVVGKTSDSQKDLPVLEGSCLALLQAQFNWDSLYREIPSTRHIPLPAQGDSLYVPFSVPTHHIFLADSASTLSGIYLHGNIAVHAKGKLSIAPSARLQYVLLFAPSIVFSERTAGCLQAFALDSLVLGKHSQLEYPSALGLVTLADTLSIGSEGVPFVRLESGSTLHGTVFTQSPPKDYILQSQLLLDPDTEVMGDVYADGYLESRGKVIGSTTCRRFSLRTPSSLYDNFILGTRLDAKELSKNYLGAGLLHAKEKKSIARWIP